jgi:hypothetical protein
VISDAKAVIRQRHLNDLAGWRVVGCVVEQVVDRAGESLAVAIDDDRLELGVECDRRGVSPSSDDGLVDQFVEAHGFEMYGLRRLSGEFDQARHQGRQLIDLLDDVGQQLLALVVGEVGGFLQDLDVGAQVTGVRSS